MVFGGGSGINAVGPTIFIWPLICCFLAAAYVYFLCPESKAYPKTRVHSVLKKSADGASPTPATGKTLEEVDALFARSPEVRARLEEEIRQGRGKHGSISGPTGRRASQVSVTSGNYGKIGTTTQTEKA